ncbi:monocarboxylate transporter 13-like [Patiria miniata]|uniref:Major facilitator superfamily (MFS) profile domain-containing protein n=1 Tax=Patiria miniata TaxID=46514 RepID=A0A914BAH7_PATMI|nr:monocarboxylate transporter 13-like [Patiria miniata]
MGICSRRSSMEETTKEFNSNGCFILLMSFSIVALWGGVLKSLGVLLPALTDQFTDHVWLTGIAISVMVVSVNIAGLFSTLLKDKFGSRRMLILSTFMVGVGLVLVPLATSIKHIAVILAVVVGPGLGIGVVLSKATLGRSFSKRYSLASGISHTGQVLSLLAFAPMMQLFLDTYGWRGATLLLAGVCFHPAVCAILARENKPQYELPVDQHDQQEPNSTCRVCLGSCFTRALSTVDLRILRQFNFWVVFSCIFGIRFVNTAWFLFYVSHLHSKGFSPQASAAICSASGVGYFFGCVVFAPFVDRGLVKCSTAVIITSLVLSLSLVVDQWSKDTLSVTVLTVLYGLSSSSLFTLSDVLTKELLGRDRLTSAFSWIGFFGILAEFLGGFLPGWIKDTTGSYDMAFVIMGITPAVAVIPLVIGRITKRI